LSSSSCCMRSSTVLSVGPVSSDILLTSCGNWDSMQILACLLGVVRVLLCFGVWILWGWCRPEEKDKNRWILCFAICIPHNSMRWPFFGRASYFSGNFIQEIKAFQSQHWPGVRSGWVKKKTFNEVRDKGGNR
jgi:hypothetical protein